ncbi:hypothetical protein TNCV_4214181 [Trichonephila clavipes]|nr:hypothetical protein TNCV_4214181 [Trichonephila clavipes]
MRVFGDHQNFMSVWVFLLIPSTYRKTDEGEGINFLAKFTHGKFWRVSRMLRRLVTDANVPKQLLKSLGIRLLTFAERSFLTLADGAKYCLSSRESSALEQVVTIHSGMATTWAGLVSSQDKPLEVCFQKVMSGGLAKVGNSLGIEPTVARVSYGFPRLLVFWVTVVYFTRERDRGIPQAARAPGMVLNV